MNGAENASRTMMMKFTETGLLPLGKSAVCPTTILGTGTIHGLGS